MKGHLPAETPGSGEDNSGRKPRKNRPGKESHLPASGTCSFAAPRDHQGTDTSLFRDMAAGREGSDNRVRRDQRLSGEQLEREPVMLSGGQDSIIDQIDEILGYGRYRRTWLRMISPRS